MTQSWQRLIISCTSGNVLQLYDYILFAYFSPIIGPLFFPGQNPQVAMLMVFGVFALGCLMRPLGAWLFGWIGDRLGRKQALLVAITMTTIATGGMGLLPTYAYIGLWAPALLLTCRIIQGLAMCGEEVGAAIYLMENAPKRRQCLAGSIILGSVYLGLLLASIVAWVTVQVFSHERLVYWGWRVAFLLVWPVGAWSFWLRSRQWESKAFVRQIKVHEFIQSPLLELFTCHWRSLFKMIGMTATLAVAVYLYAVYLPTVAHIQYHLVLTHIMMINMVCFLLTAGVAFLTGYYADYRGFILMMRWACGLLIGGAFPIMWLLHRSNPMSFIVAQLLLSIITGIAAGSLMPFFLTAFPVQVRFIGTALAFNISMSCLGSTAPLVVSYLDQHVQSSYLAAAYLIALALLTYGLTYLNLPTARRP